MASRQTNGTMGMAPLKQSTTKKDLSLCKKQAKTIKILIHPLKH